MLSTKLKEAAGNSADATLYVNDVFSTWLYTGTGASQTITNGIDLAGKGGMVWVKIRSDNGYDLLFDTSNGAGKFTRIIAGSQVIESTSLTSFNSDGFSLGSWNESNANNSTYASWVFRKAAKFFDIVTYTGTGVTQTIAHSLGSTPAMIFVKNLDSGAAWMVNTASSVGANEYLTLNTTNSFISTVIDPWASTRPTNSNFTVSSEGVVNANGNRYVAYLFADNSASDGLIRCGNYTGNASTTGPIITLGWEPQFILIKKSGGGNGGNWHIIDSMRGMPVGSADADLLANTFTPESSVDYVSISATGFQIVSSSAEVNQNVTQYIYMAIRRPNKPPTSGTQVYYPVARSGTGATGSSTSFGQVTDLVFTKQRGSTQTWAWTDRLRGATLELTSAATTAETAYANDLTGFDIMTGFYFGSGASGQMNTSGSTYDDHLFRRAPGFFDVVCYTGTGVATTQAHNLGVAPELMIVKKRSVNSNWAVGNMFEPSGGSSNVMFLDVSDKANFTGYGVNNFFSGPPSSSSFYLSTNTLTNGSGATYVAYLFATLAGISKVGSYTGNGTGQAIACGFSAGARFVLIKRTDSTGDWYTFDSARGLTSGSSPYLLLNSTAAEVTGNNGVYASTGGFTLGATASTTTNINAATYIFLAVA